MKFKDYISELKRRNVFKSAVAYLIVAWLIVQVLSILLPTFNASPVYLKNTIILLIIGFPVWLVLSWIFELTPTGFKKTEDAPIEFSANKTASDRLNKIIIGGLSIVIVVLVGNLMFSESSDVTSIPLKTNISVDDRNSIAVLPFANMSTDDDNTFFTEGMHEDVLNKLAGIKELKVIARTSVMPYADYKGSLDTLGLKLGVKFILEGSVRRFNNQIRVSANLVEAATGTSVWSSSYDRTIDNVFKLQNEIAQEITQTLKTELSQDESTNLNQIPTTVIEAYDNFIKARNILNSYYNTEELKQAIDFLEKAVDYDPKFEAGWELLSTSYVDLYERGLDFEDNQVSFMAKVRSKQALNQLEHLNNEGVYYFRAKAQYENIVEGNQMMALRSFDKALQLFPNDAKTLFSQGMLMMSLNQPAEGVRNFEAALNLDNQNFMINMYLRMSYQYGRHYEKLIPMLEQLYKEAPSKTHILVEIKYYQFLLDGKIASFNALKETIENLEITESCNLTIVKDNKMVVAMFNNNFENYIQNWMGTWDDHYKDHGNWSCPAIVNDELNKASLMLSHGKQTEAGKIIASALEYKGRPINEQSVCVYNKSVYEPKLDYLLGNTELALEKFHNEIPRVMNLQKFPRAAVEREVLLQTADMVAPDEVYTIYKQVIEIPFSMVGLETICANPWTYPNLIKNKNFQKEIVSDGRFVDFLRLNKFL